MIKKAKVSKCAYLLTYLTQNQNMETSTHNIIYRVVNKFNDKVYIGATTKSLEERKRDHAQKALKGKGSAFQEAIAKYSVDNFIWEEIDTAENLNILAEKEKKYIKFYDSNHTGYNSDEGGGFKKTVYQYDQDGNLIGTFSSLKEIETRLHIDKRRVSNACTHSSLCNGNFWSYKENDTFQPPSDAKKRKVMQFDMENKLIQTYGSVSEASKMTGISKTCIARCCRGERESSKGFIWKY